MFRQVGRERPSISVRTRDGGPDATVLTGKFGGGGHARAAGATVELPIDDAMPGGARQPRAPCWPRVADSIDGVLVVAKEPGPTSHDIVALVRRLTGVKRVGHGGTLDPFAAGVLPVFIGHATRLVEYHLTDAQGVPRQSSASVRARPPTTSRAS